MTSRATPRRCAPTAHHWKLEDRLVMGLPDPEGWYRVLLQRVCTVCAWGELWIAEQNLAKRLLKLLEEEHRT